MPFRFSIREFLYMTKHLLSFICLFFVYHVQAQDFTLNGVVQDAESGETLIGAIVLATQGEQQTVAVTNEYGFYAMQLAQGDYRLRVSYIGYNNHQTDISISANQRLDIEMSIEGSNIEEIVVESDAFENIESTEISTQKLDMSTIRQVPVALGEVDILKTLQLLPGVTNAGEGASGFNVRGGAADQNLILFDEATIYNSDHLFGFVSVFNSDAIKDVKLYKGGIPSKFGGRLSSVLDVHQKEGNNKKFSGNGGIGLISSRLMLEGPIEKEKSSFLLAGRRSYADAFLALTNNSNRLGFYDLNTKINRTFSDKSKLYLSGYFGNDSFNIDELFVNKWGNRSGTLRWNYLFNDRLFSNTSLIFSKYDYHFDFDLIEFEWNSDIRNLNIKSDFQYFLNNNNSLYFGAEAKRYDFNPGKITPTSPASAINEEQLDQKNALEASIYIGNEQRLNDRLTMNYGARFTYFDRRGEQDITNYANDMPIVYNPVLNRYEEGMITGVQQFGKESIHAFHGIEPRISLNYLLSDLTSIKASYNRTKQYIHLITNTNSPTPIDIWAPSGPFIKPQKAHQFALGLFRNFNVNAYELSAEIYYRSMNDLLDYVDGAELIANNKLETVLLNGRGRAYGLELYGKKNTGKLTGWLSYTYSKTEKFTPGITTNDPGINNGKWYPANYDRPHDLSITGFYKLNDRWAFGSNLIYQTGRPVTFPVGSYTYNNLVFPLYENRNNDRLPDYHRIDLSATLGPKNRDRKVKGEWIFSLYNVYNRQNASSVYFAYDEDEKSTVANQLTIFGIVPGISYNFKF